mmetsp:Transcript_18060/g.41446  ORF Transcript_18060/g.41446 Transcript_18060/m.41446 type:complete len:800 (+) Transcript_18060:398-2797(+)
MVLGVSFFVYVYQYPLLIYGPPAITTSPTSPNAGSCRCHSSAVHRAPELCNTIHIITVQSTDLFAIFSTLCCVNRNDMFMVDRQSLFHLLGIFGQCFEHEVKRKRRHERRLLCIGSASMATLDVFVIVHRPVLALAFVPELLDELSCVPRMDAIVAGAGGHKDRRVRLAVRIDVVVRTVLVQKVVPILVGIAVLGHPARPRQERVEALHVQQRNRTVNGPPQVGPHHVHVAHEQPSVAAPSRGQRLGLADARIDQVLANRDKVLVGLVAVLLQGRLVPAGTIFPTSPDVGLDVDPPALEPGQTCRGAVSGGQGDLETTVAVEERRILAIELDVLLPDHEIRNLGSVFAGCKLLLDHQIVGIVLGRQALEFFFDEGIFLLQSSLFLDLAQVGGVHGARSGVTTRGEPEFVVLFGIDGSAGGGADLRLGVTSRNLRDRVSVVPELVEFQFRFDGVRSGQDEVVFGHPEPAVRGLGRGFEQNTVVDGCFSAAPKLFKVAIYDRSLLVGDAIVLRSPVRSQFDKENVSHVIQRSVVLDFHFSKFWLGQILWTILGLEQVVFGKLRKPVLAGIKSDAARVDLPEVSSPVSFVGDVSVHRHIRRFSLKDGWGFFEGGSAGPLLDGSRIPGIREGTFPEIGSDQQDIASLVADAGLGLPDKKGAVLLADEFAGGQVEFLDVDRIGSTARELEQGPRHNLPVGGILAPRQEGAALVDPAHAVFFRERVDVKNRGPGRFVAAIVFFLGGFPPDSLGVLLVLPEIEINALVVLVGITSVARGVGDAIFRLENLQYPVVSRSLRGIAERL